jgi:hypothetical protein
MRDSLERAYRELGQHAWLVEVARESTQGAIAFIGLLSKLIPAELRASINVDLNLVTIRSFVRDTDVTVIELSPSQPPQVGACTPAQEVEQCVIEVTAKCPESQ